MYEYKLHTNKKMILMENTSSNRRSRRNSRFKKSLSIWWDSTVGYENKCSMSSFWRKEGFEEITDQITIKKSDGTFFRKNQQGELLITNADKGFYIIGRGRFGRYRDFIIPGQISPSIGIEVGKKYYYDYITDDGELLSNFDIWSEPLEELILKPKDY